MVCAAVVAGTSSCVNEWLDQEPSTGVDAGSAVTTTSDLTSVRAGLYAAVKGNSSLTDYYGRQMFIYGDVRGEDVQYNWIDGSGRGDFYYYMTYSTASDFNGNAIWQTPFVVISRANYVIDYAEGGTITDAEDNQATISQYAAEARVLRAMALFDLTRIYGTPYTEDQGASLGAPIITEPVGDPSVYTSYGDDFCDHGVFINKLPQPDEATSAAYSNVPLLRLSEVYLSAAEAASQTGDLSRAAELLNSIITNRTTDVSKTVTAADITLDRIYEERRKELVGEGQRYFDVLRRGETVTRYTDVNDRGWHDALSEEARTFNRDSEKALPLIPQSELDVNPDMQQNPEY